MDVKEKVKNVLSKNIHDGIVLLKAAISMDSPVYNSAVLFESRYHVNKQSFYEGTLSVADYNLEQNRIVAGLLNLADQLSITDVGANNVQKINEIQQDLTDKIKKISINEINNNPGVPNHHVIFKMAIKILFWAIIASCIPGFIEGWNSYQDKESSAPGFGWHDYTILFFLLFFSYQYYRYRKNNRNWQAVGQKELNIEIAGKHDAVMDLLFQVFNDLNLRILSFQRGEGVLIAETGRFVFNKWIVLKIENDDAQKLDTYDLTVSCNHKYPSLMAVEFNSNQSVLDRIKHKLIENNQYE